MPEPSVSLLGRIGIGGATFDCAFQCDSCGTAIALTFLVRGVKGLRITDVPCRGCNATYTLELTPEGAAPQSLPVLPYLALVPVPPGAPS